MENRPPNLPVSFNDSDARLWAMLTHLSAIPGSLVLIGSIVLPLVIWQIQKEKSDFVDFHGKEAVNFNITMAFAAVVASVLVFFLIGIFLIWLVGAVWLLFTVIAAIRANNGEYYRYPFSIRIIK